VVPEDLPVAEFAFPGPLRDQLVAAILSGAKTTTTGLAADYEHEGEPLPRPGQRQAVVDSAGHRVAVIETTEVRLIRLGDVSLAHAVAEGEGHTSVAEWRAAHEQFWHSPEMRQALNEPDFTVDDDTLVVTQAFQLTETALGSGTQIARWIERYRRAWETADADEIVDLFTPDAPYRSSVFREPYVGSAAIRGYWQRGAGSQRDVKVRMGRPVLGADRVAVEWWTTMIDPDEGEVTLPGCLLLRFAPDGRCAELWEYWQVKPGRQDPPAGWGA
jgi:uncharacterized protein YhfF